MNVSVGRNTMMKRIALKMHDILFKVIKTNHNDCLKIRQIKTYLKQLKNIPIINEVEDID